MDVVDPLGYRNHYEFTQSDAVNYPQVSWPRETLHSIYSETGALLRTTQTTYVYVDTYCSCPAYPKDVTTTLNDTGGTTLVTKTHYDYDTFQSTVMWPPYDPLNGIDYRIKPDRTQPIDNPANPRIQLRVRRCRLSLKGRQTLAESERANSGVDYSTRPSTSEPQSHHPNLGRRTTKVAETHTQYDNYAANPLTAAARASDTAYGIARTRGNSRPSSAGAARSRAFCRLPTMTPAMQQSHRSARHHARELRRLWGNAGCTPTSGNAAAYLTAVTDALTPSPGPYNSCISSMASFRTPTASPPLTQIMINGPYCANQFS
jgi:hypothetical protein